MAGRQQRRQQWEGRIARWRASGVSMAAHCHRHGLSHWMFVRWRRRIERTVTPAASLTLIPVVGPTPSGGAITIRLPDGRPASGGAIDMAELTLLLEGIDLRVPRLRAVELQRVY